MHIQKIIRVNRLFNSLFLPLLLVLAACCQHSSGQAVLSASVSKNTVATGEQFQLTYNLNSAGRNFQGPDLKDFYVLGGPNQSSQIQIVNGSYSQSLIFTYYLQAKSEGNFKISFASIEADGKRIQSNGLILNVVKGNSNAQQGQGGNNNQSQNSNGVGEKNIFLRAEVSKTNVYQGEALSVTFKLFTNVNIVNYTVSKMPSMSGFWNQEIALPEQLQLHNETVDGVNYKVGVLKKVVLFPQQSGTLSIDPMELECIARIQVKGGRNPFFNDPFFNDPFFGLGSAQDVKYAFRSNKVNVNVKELPPNAPLGFNGSVGVLQFNAFLDKKETKANEPVSLKLKISGNGNLKLINAPEINLPPDIESYDPKINDNLHVSENGVSGTKNIEYLIIPRREGTYELAPITFSYYDLQKKQYVSKTEGPFTLKVGKGTGGSGSAVSNSINKSDFQLLGKDIRYIKIQEPEFITANGTFYGSVSYYGLMISPMLLFFGLLIYRKKMEAINSDIVSLKSRKATAVALKRLKVAQKLLDSNQVEALQEEISKAMWGYMSDKLSIPFAELSRETIQSSLTMKNVNPEHVSVFIGTLDKCEMSRFAGGSTTNDAELYEQAVKAISDIEQSLKS